MISNIIFVVDASGSMNESFFGDGKPSKFDAVREAFQMFFDRHAKVKTFSLTDRSKLGLLSYKTEGLTLERVDIKEVYPLAFFPPSPNPGRLKDFGPIGNSPLYEAIKEATSALSNNVGKKVMAIVTGDSKSNFRMKMEQLKTETIPAIQKAGITVALLQVGNAKQNQEFDELAKTLHPVAIQELRLRPEIVTTVEGINDWLERLLSSTTTPAR